MARLPTVGGDDGNWGTVLNEYLQTEHASDGSHGLSTGLVTDVINTQGSVGSTYTIPAPTVAGIHSLTLTTNCQLTFPAAVAGQSFTLIIRQGGSGNYSITWPTTTILWSAGVAPLLTTTVGAIDIIGFFTDGVNWFGFVSGQNMSTPI